MADTLLRHRGVSVIYVLWYTLGVYFDPSLLESPLFLPCCLLTLVASIAGEYLAWRYAFAPAIPPYCGRVILLVSVVRPWCIGSLIGLSFYTHGITLIRTVSAAVLMAFSIGAVLTDRPNLKAARASLFGYLVPGIAGAAFSGAPTGWSLAAVQLTFLLYCLRQNSLENKSYWALLHAERELRAVQRIKAQHLQREALDLAQQARSMAIASERSRIAAEWHDSLLADLSSATLQLESARRRLDRGEAPGLSIDRAMQSIRQGKSEARLLIHDMFSVGHSDESLTERLERELGDIATAAGANLIFSGGADPAALLSPGDARQIARICGEAVSNAVRHGAAREVEVVLRHQPQILEFSITDNGSGFDPASTNPGHFGLDIMRSRARRLNGTLDIQSQRGQGTSVTLRLPRRGTPVNPIRVLIVDDHFMTRLALKTLLEEEDAGFKVVAEAADCADALRQFDELLPDVTILDLRLPDGSGLGVLKQLHQRYHHAKVIVISNLEGSEHIARALSAGALGFLGKDAPAEEILTAIREVHQGRQFLSGSASRRLEQRAALEELSPREQDVIELLVRGLSNQAIADQLGISEKTVRAHMTSIFTKLRVTDRTQAAMLAVTRGLVDPAPART